MGKILHVYGSKSYNYKYDPSHELGVAGELDALGQMPYLKHLRLSGLQVSGDLKAFVSLNRFEYLEELDLSRTQVAGDFEALWLLEALRKVSLAHSRVSGTVQVNGFSELQQLDLSGTAVTGWVASMDECCPKLLEINLAVAPSGHKDP